MDVDPAATTVLATPTSTSSLSRGDVIADRYRVEALIGRGAMGVVYRVEHQYMRKRFALKVLDAEWAKTPGAYARFEREAIAAGNIANPHVAHATDFGRLGDGSCFLVLEYLDGRTLRTALKRGRLKPRRALLVARGIVSGLEAAHAVGIVHRDLKPENVMLVDRDGDPDYVKVLDFGIARFEPSAASRPSLEVVTIQGTVLGSPPYMAPEQATGESADARTDLYSTGIILFEMLTGNCPFVGDAASVMRAHVTQEAPPLPSPIVAAAGEPVALMLQRLLSKEPAARFASARELGLALDECLRGNAGTGSSIKTVREPRASRPSGTREASPLGRWIASCREYVLTRRRHARFRRVVAWPSGIFARMRGWRLARPGSPRAVTEAIKTRLLQSLAYSRSRLTPRQLASAVVVSIALVLAATVWFSTCAATPAGSSAPAASKGYAPSGPSPSHPARRRQ